MERVMGIEPTQPAWKAGVLPLNYTRISLNHDTTPRPPCQVFFQPFLAQICTSSPRLPLTREVALP